MRTCVVFGCGFQGQTSIKKLRKFYNVLGFSDNNEKLWGSIIDGVPVLSPGELDFLCNESKIDIFICTLTFQTIVSQLRKKKADLFVCMWGFVYKVGEDCVLYPYSLNKVSPYRKKDKAEKNILYVQDTACIRTHKFANIMAELGYKVFLLYVFCSPDDTIFSQYSTQYDQIFTVSSPDDMIAFVNNSEFDIIHSSNAPDIVTNILLQSNKKIVFDVHDTVTLAGDDVVTFENLVFENLANTGCDGVIYTSEGILNVSRKRYNIGFKPSISIGNLPLKETCIDFRSDKKLSRLDHEIHLVYEGSISKIPGNVKYMVDQWETICATGIHVHFYTNADSEYCMKLAERSSYLHYEGEVARDELIKLLTQYDAGLLVQNITDENRLFAETASPNKIYEYLNAGLPVIGSMLNMHQEFMDKYKAGIVLDFNQDILKQVKSACEIEIEDHFLTKNHLTLSASAEKLEQFYDDVISS